MDRVLRLALRVISGATSKTSGEAILYYMGFENMKQTYKLQDSQEHVSKTQAYNPVDQSS